MSISFENPAGLSATDLENGTRLAPRFDANGLVTAIATEAGSGAVLMIAHMNADALKLTLETGYAHYYSRSRKAIWKKGETSGETQKLVEMRIDCDQDAILMMVKPQGHGAACHTGRKSCFYRRIEMRDGRPVLVDLGDKPLFDPAKIYK